MTIRRWSRGAASGATLAEVTEGEELHTPHGAARRNFRTEGVPWDRRKGCRLLAAARKERTRALVKSIR